MIDMDTPVELNLVLFDWHILSLRMPLWAWLIATAAVAVAGSHALH